MATPPTSAHNLRVDEFTYSRDTSDYVTASGVKGGAVSGIEEFYLPSPPSAIRADVLVSVNYDRSIFIGSSPDTGTCYFSVNYDIRDTVPTDSVLVSGSLSGVSELGSVTNVTKTLSLVGVSKALLDSVVVRLEPQSCNCAVGIPSAVTCSLAVYAVHVEWSNVIPPSLSSE